MFVFCHWQWGGTVWKPAPAHFKTWLVDFQTWLNHFKAWLNDFKTWLNDFKTWLNDFKTWLNYFKTWLNHLTAFPVVIKGRCANLRACKLFLNLQLNASDSSFGGNVSSPRLFYLVGTWESDNKYSTRYSSRFLADSRWIRLNGKISCSSLYNIYYTIYTISFAA